MPRHNLSGLTDFTVDAAFDFARDIRRLKGTTCDFAQATERTLSLNTGLPRDIVHHQPHALPVFDQLSVLAMNS